MRDVFGRCYSAFHATPFQKFDYDSFEAYTLKITRDSEMEIEAELGEGIVDKVSKGIKSRRFGYRFVFV